MASAIIGGLLRQGLPPAQIEVVEPFARGARSGWRSSSASQAQEQAGAGAGRRRRWWSGRSSRRPSRRRPRRRRPHVRQALHLSVAAGIRSDSIAAWLGTERIVRSMPNTPALVGKGMTALFAPAGRRARPTAARVEQVIATTGELAVGGAGGSSSTR